MSIGAMRIHELRWTIHSNVVEWIADGPPRRVAYQKAIRSAVLLRDRSRIAVVEPLTTYGENNAVILNADGSLRFRLLLPIKDGSVYGFDQMYYVDDELTIVVAVTGRDFAYVVDEKTGEYTNHYEMR
jgi:hypothetical protein